MMLMKVHTTRPIKGQISFATQRPNYGSLVSLASGELRGSPWFGVRTLDHSPEEEQHIDLERPDEDDVGRHAGTEPFRNPNVRLGLVNRHGLPLGKREDM